MKNLIHDAPAALAALQKDLNKYNRAIR